MREGNWMGKEVGVSCLGRYGGGSTLLCYWKAFRPARAQEVLLAICQTAVLLLFYTTPSTALADPALLCTGSWPPPRSLAKKQ